MKARGGKPVISRLAGCCRLVWGEEEGGNVEEGGWEKQLTDGGRRADTEAKDCHFLASARPASD